MRVKTFHKYLYTVTRKLTRLRRRIGLQVKLFLLNRYVVGSLPYILNLIGSDFKLSWGGGREREREMNS